MSVYNTYLKPNYEPIIPVSDKETAAEEKPAAESVPAENENTKDKKAKKG